MKPILGDDPTTRIAAFGRLFACQRRIYPNEVRGQNRTATQPHDDPWKDTHRRTTLAEAHRQLASLPENITARNAKEEAGR